MSRVALDADDFKQFADDYYRVRVSVLETPTGRWVAKGRIERVDSGEEIGGEGKFGKDRDEAIAGIFEPLRLRMSVLQRPPHEWKRVAIRQLLLDYRKFNDELTHLGVTMEKMRKDGDISKEQLHEMFWKVREAACKGSVDLARKLETLPEQDRIDLMTSAESVYQNPGDLWNLDDLDGRDALFSFILDPSDAVVNAHCAHRERWGG
jgi:hypothetical protein